MGPKVVFLAYANSRTDPLPTLKKEEEDVYRTLVHRIAKGHFFVHPEPFATLESINEYLGKFSDNLVLFHYSGHAGSNCILLDDKEANAEGIAYQLKESAKSGVLKLVVLNGCSTGDQVKRLIELGVPAVIATHAPVEDSSATEFAVRFYHNMSEMDMSIKDAFLNALGPAQTVTKQDLGLRNKSARHIDFFSEKPKNTPLWELFCKDDESLEINPFPGLPPLVNHSFTPNNLLVETLYKGLAKAGNRHIKNLEERGDYIESGEKQTAIVNVLPFPVGIHLQKLLCPVEQENEGFDKLGLQRIEQIAEVFHETMELLGFVMLAQLWELKLKDVLIVIPEQIINVLSNYFYLTAQQRSTFDYFSLIGSIRTFFDSLNNGNGITYFIEELNTLKEFTGEGHPFTTACDYLATLRKDVINHTIREEEIAYKCKTGEEKLCDFFDHLIFLHRYELTSIQNIEILKCRHQLKPEFNHHVVKLMQAIGKPELKFYLRHAHFDNRGVVLLKGNYQVINSQRKLFRADNFEFLSLSPFVIDRNAFEPNSDLSNLMFFDQFRKQAQVYSFKRVKRPNSIRDRMEVTFEEKFEPIFLEFKAFHTMILNESI